MSGATWGTPGVYVRSAPSEPTLQLTAVPAFIGIAAQGPLHHPERIRNWDEYVSVFGGFLDYAYLPHSVFGFFRNGGIRCFVVRVADLTDYSAENLPGQCPRVDLLRAATNATPVRDFQGDETLRIAAINQGQWGNRLRFEVLDGSQRQMTLTTLRSPAAAGAATLAVTEPFDLTPGTSIRLAPPGTPFGGIAATVLTVDGVNNTVTLTAVLTAALPAGTAVMGQGFKLVIYSGDRNEVFDNLSASATNLRYYASVINAADDGMFYTERQAQGYSTLVRVASVTGAGGQQRFRPIPPAPGQNVLTSGGDGFRYASVVLRDAGNLPSIRLVARASSDPTGATLGTRANGLLVRARPFATRLALPVSAGADQFVVENAGGLTVGDSITLTDPANAAVTETHSLAAVNAGNVVRLAAVLANAYPFGSAVTETNRFTLSLFRDPAGEPIEVHRNLSADPAGGRYFRQVFAVGSQLVCGDGPDVLLQPPLTPAGDTPLSGGRDPGGIDFRWYTGYDGAGVFFAPAGSTAANRYGLATVEDNDEIDLVAVPDLAGAPILVPDPPATADAIHLRSFRQVLYHAAKLGDRIALIDPLSGTSADHVASLPSGLADPASGKFGALYYPWLKTTVSGTERMIPPSGFVAGVIARAQEQYGAGRAPANFPLLDIVDLEVLLDEEAQDDLNPAGVNCARKFDRPVIELWGARTMSADPLARYLSIRRLLLSVKKALNRNLRWAVFEPEGPVLWQRIQNSLQSLMQTLVTGGETAASDSGGSFFVKCDAETNPPDVREAGMAVAKIGIALTAPAEFIVLNVKRTPDSVLVNEDGG